MSLAYLEAQPDADLLKQMLGLIPTPPPERVPKGPGGRPRGPSKNGRRSEPEHGTYYFYRAYRCRCDPCRWAKNAEMRAYYERKRARVQSDDL